MLYNEFPHTMIAGYNFQEDSVSEDIRQCEKDFNKTLLCIGKGKELTGWYYQSIWSKEYEVKLGMDGINKHMDGSVPQLVVHLLFTDFYKELTLKIKED